MASVSRRTKLICGVAAGGALGVATLAGCGSSNSSNTAATSAAADTTTSAAPSSEAKTMHGKNAAYRQCLQQNGVVFPSRGAHPSHQASGDGATSTEAAPHMHHKMGPPAGVSQDTWNKAVAACASLKPSHTAKPTS
jgi:hypothetical protein